MTVYEKARVLFGQKLSSGVGRVRYVRDGTGISGNGYEEWIDKVSLVYHVPTKWIHFGKPGGLVCNPDRLVYPVTNRRITGVYGIERVERIYLECTAWIEVLGDLEIKDQI